jgi:multiple antibiotic resistance protein
MVAASAGTITAVLTPAAVHTPDGLPVTALVAAVIGTGVTFAVMPPRHSRRLACRARDAGNRYPLHGLIVASMGMQFVFTGMKAFLG